MQRRPKRTTDALKLIDHLLYDGKPQRLKALEELRANDEVGRKIYQLRTKAKLTQAQLASLIGTTASVICRLEDADYEGHSLAMLAPPRRGAPKASRKSGLCRSENRLDGPRRCCRRRCPFATFTHSPANPYNR